MQLGIPSKSARLTPRTMPWFIIAFAMVMLILAACSSPTPLQPVQADDGSVPADETPAPSAEDESDDSQATESAVSSAEQETHNDIPVGFTAEGYPYRGNPDAPVTMYEFSDLQCPFCQRYFIQTEPAINDAYVREGSLRVVFRDFPLVQLHPNAPAAHLASLCVADQGSAKAYWEMHAQLFRTVEEWANLDEPNQHFVDLATEVGIDVGAFEMCLADEAQAAVLAARVADAEAIGFSGTPTFQFVREETGDTYQLVGAQPFDQFASMIDALVAGEAPATAAQEQSGGNQEIPLWATAEGLRPDPNRPGYTVAGDQYRGNPDASVVVVEYSDFQCPFCAQHSQDTQPILDEKFVDTDQIFWVFKHFPLSIHPQAPAAGVAAECAAEQGKFWEMHQLLFANVSAWSVSDPTSVFTDLAGQLALDTVEFGACLQDEEMMARVQSDLEDGGAYVRGTPTFIVLYEGQGSIIPGALPADRFASILEEVLAGLSAQ